MIATVEDFSALVDRVAHLNSLDRELASRLVSKVGDTPEEDAAGLVVVTDDTGKEQHLQWPWEE